MLGEPTFVSSHIRRNAQRKAFLAQQRVAAVAGTIRPDLARLRVMDDVFGVIARPLDVFFACLQGRADGVNARHEFSIHAQHIKHRLAHARHDFHVDGDIGAVRQLDADVRNRRAQRAHAERDHVHGAAGHAAVKQGLQRGAHLGRGHPVVGRAGVVFFGRADVGAVFHPRHVARVAQREKAVRPLGFVQFFERAGVHQLLAQALVFSVAAVTPIHGVGLAQGDHVCHPGDQFCIFYIAGGVKFKPLHGGMVHRKTPELKSALSTTVWSR